MRHSPWMGDTEISLPPKCESCQVCGTEGERCPSWGYPGQARPPPAPCPARGDLPPGGSSLHRDPLSEPEREQIAPRFSPTKASGLPPTHFGIRPVCLQPTRVVGEGSVPVGWRDLCRGTPGTPGHPPRDHVCCRLSGLSPHSFSPLLQGWDDANSQPGQQQLPEPPGSGVQVLGWPEAPRSMRSCCPRCQQEGTCKKPRSPSSLGGKRAQPEPPVPEPAQTQGHRLTEGSIQMFSPTQVKYLLHRLVQDPLQVPHLDADHEGCGAADGVEQALWDHGDVGVSPGEGVEESSHRMDALRQDAAGQGAIMVPLHEKRELHCSERASHPELSCILHSFKRFLCGFWFVYF